MQFPLTRPSSLGTVGESLLVDAGEDGLGDLLEDDELGHGVGDPAMSRILKEEGIGAFYSGFGPILFKQ
jgi:hypothetical protein